MSFTEAANGEPGRVDNDADRLEERLVRVSEPGLSQDANEQLTQELRNAIGKGRVRVPESRPHAERDEPPSGGPISTTLAENKFMIGMVVPTALMVGVVVLVLLINQWWAMALGMVALLAATYGVLALIVALTGFLDEPTDTSAALLEEEGVRDPERLFSDLVGEFTEQGLEAR